MSDTVKIVLLWGIFCLVGGGSISACQKPSAPVSDDVVEMFPSSPQGSRATLVSVIDDRTVDCRIYRVEDAERHAVLYTMVGGSLCGVLTRASPSDASE